MKLNTLLFFFLPIDRKISLNYVFYLISSIIQVFFFKILFGGTKLLNKYKQFWNLFIHNLTFLFLKLTYAVRTNRINIVYVTIIKLYIKKTLSGTYTATDVKTCN